MQNLARAHARSWAQEDKGHRLPQGASPCGYQRDIPSDQAKPAGVGRSGRDGTQVAQATTGRVLSEPVPRETLGAMLFPDLPRFVLP